MSQQGRLDSSMEGANQSASEDAERDKVFPFELWLSREPSNESNTSSVSVSTLSAPIVMNTNSLYHYSDDKPCVIVITANCGCEIHFPFLKKKCGHYVPFIEKK